MCAKDDDETRNGESRSGRQRAAWSWDNTAPARSQGRGREVALLGRYSFSTVAAQTGRRSSGPPVPAATTSSSRPTMRNCAPSCANSTPSDSSRRCASVSGQQKRRPEVPPPSSSPSPSTLATHQASLAWLAGCQPPSKRRNPTRRLTLRKRESTSGACSATKFLSADSSKRGEARAVVDKRPHFGSQQARLMDLT